MRLVYAGSVYRIRRNAEPFVELTIAWLSSALLILIILLKPGLGLTSRIRPDLITAIIVL